MPFTTRINLAEQPRQGLVDYLDGYQPGALPESALPLYHLALAFAEASPHNELYDCSNTVPNSFAAHRFVAAHGEIIDR